MLLKNKLLISGILTSATLLGAAATQAEVIFKESFDSQSDWTSTMHSTVSSQEAQKGDRLPGNWDAIYQGTRWAPETGFPNNHASLEILGKNSEKARGGVGKSAVFWRESYSAGWKNWASDAQLVKLLGREFDQLYIEFWIKFDDNWFGRKPQETSGWI